MKEGDRGNAKCEAEYRFEEMLYILHQADVRCINDVLKKRKKEKK